nr:very short patch repair endonuclease [Mucilaginibacter lappiensis]
MVRKYLFSQGFRFRLHPKNLPGKPDIVCQNTKRLFLFIDVFGIIMIAVNRLPYQKRMPTSGLLNFNIIGKMICVSMRH